MSKKDNSFPPGIVYKGKDFHDFLLAELGLFIPKNIILLLFLFFVKIIKKTNNCNNFILCKPLQPGMKMKFGKIFSQNGSKTVGMTW